MDAVYFALLGASLVLTSVGMVLWRFRKTLNKKEYEDKYKDL
jgi:hypothetical protein